MATVNGGPRGWIRLPGRLYTESYTNIDVDGGYVAVVLGASGGQDSSVFETGELWVQVTVDGQALGARQPFANVGRAGFAISSGHVVTSDNQPARTTPQVRSTRPTPIPSMD